MKVFSKTKWMDRALFAVLIFLFILPLLLITALAAFPRAKWLDTDWLQNRTLWSAGPEIKIPLSWKNVFSADCQSGLTKNFDLTLPGRECIARLYNELSFRIFNKSATPDRFTFGRNGTPYEVAYLREYFIERPDITELEALVRDLATLQEACHKAGVAFVFVITPSKASIYPEDAPPGWQSRFDPRHRGYDLLLGLLKKYRIPFVDGPALTREEKAKPESSVPVFPKGGSHWGSLSALATSNALLDLLRAQGLPVHNINGQASLTQDPYSREGESDSEGIEMDCYSVMNLAIPWTYPVAHYKVLPDLSAQPKKFTMAFIGGSFLYRPIHQMMDSGQFDEIDYYYYFDQARHKYILDGKDPWIEKITPDYGRDIFAADALILEVNEQRIPDAQHLKKFLQEVLKNLPVPGEPKKTFSYKSWPRIGWETPLKYCTDAGALAVPHSTTSGFSSLQETYTWTDGKTAKLVLILPAEVRENVFLQARVAAFLDAKLPGQKVDVYVNDEKVTEWKFSNEQNEADRIIPLPKTILGEKGDRLVTLRFEIDHPTAPFDLGLSPDKRKLGFMLREIRLAR